MRLIRPVVMIALALMIAASANFARAQDSAEITIYRNPDSLMIVTPGIPLNGLAFEITLNGGWKITQSPLGYPAFRRLDVTGLTCLFIIKTGSSPDLPTECQGAAIGVQELPSSDPFWADTADGFNVVDTRSGRDFGVCERELCRITFAPASDETLSCVGSVRADETLIVVARFDTSSTQAMLPDQEWEALFELATEVFDDSLNFRILTVPEIVSTQLEARNLADCYGAAMVVWGFMTPLRFETNFTLRQPWDSRDTAPIQPEPMTDQVRLLVALDGSDSLYLLHFVRANLLYITQNFEAAVPFLSRAIASAPEGHERELSVALLHFYMGYIEQAVNIDLIGAYTAYSTALSLDPNANFAPAAYNNRGLVSSTQRQYAAALDDFDRAIALQPDSASAYNNRGVTYLNRGQFALATADFDQAIALQPEYASAFHNRGTAHAQQGQIDLALDDYNQAIALQPDFAMAYFDRGTVYLNRGRDDLAFEDFTTTIDLLPNFADAYNNRGTVYYNQELYSLAIVEFNRAIALEPELVTAFYNRGTAYSIQGDAELAIADFDQVIALNANHVNAYHSRALIRYRQGDYESAVADFDQAISRRPGDPQLYYLRGNTYYLLRDYDRAVSDYNQALALQPDYVEALGNRGLTRIQQNQHRLAIADFDAAIDLRPDDARLYYFRSQANYFRGEAKRAIDDLDQAITLMPTFADAFYWRGMIHSRQEDYRLAIADLDQAIALQRNVATYFYERGEAYFSLDKYDLAIEDYQQAIALQPDYTDAYWALGLVYRFNNQDAEALPYYRRYVELAGSDADAMAVDTLRELEATYGD